MDFTRWQWHYNKTQQTIIYTSHKITHNAQRKHSTQSYLKIKGHITHNEYNTQKAKLFLQQAVEAYA
jgi:hypothetical protein